MHFFFMKGLNIKSVVLPGRVVDIERKIVPCQRLKPKQNDKFEPYIIITNPGNILYVGTYAFARQSINKNN